MDAESKCLCLWCHIPFLSSNGCGSMDILIRDRHVWRSSVSTWERNISPAAKGRPEQRAQQNTAIWRKGSCLISAVSLPTKTCVSKQTECGDYFLLGDTWNPLPGLWTSQWDGSLFYVRCPLWAMPFIICVVFRLSANLLMAIHKWPWIFRNQEFFLCVMALVKRGWNLAFPQNSFIILLFHI